MTLCYEKVIGKLGTYKLAVMELEQLIEASRLHRFNCYHARARALLVKLIDILQELVPYSDMLSKEIWVVPTLEHFQAQLRTLDNDPPPSQGAGLFIEIPADCARIVRL